MFVTSTSEVAMPGIFDLLDVRFYDLLRLPELRGGQADVYGHVHARMKPKFRLTIRMCDVHMNSCLFARELEETERPITNDGRRHSVAL